MTTMISTVRTSDLYVRYLGYSCTVHGRAAQTARRRCIPLVYALYYCDYYAPVPSGSASRTNPLATHTRGRLRPRRPTLSRRTHNFRGAGRARRRRRRRRHRRRRRRRRGAGDGCSARWSCTTATSVSSALCSARQRDVSGRAALPHPEPRMMGAASAALGSASPSARGATSIAASAPRRGAVEPTTLVELPSCSRPAVARTSSRVLATREAGRSDARPTLDSHSSATARRVVGAPQPLAVVRAAEAGKAEQRLDDHARVALQVHSATVLERAPRGRAGRARCWSSRRAAASSAARARP